METLKDLRNILLEHKIKVFTDHKNLTYETIESASQRVHHWKCLIQEFGVTILYIKGEANLVADDFSLIPMVHYVHKLADSNLEEDTCELLRLDSLFISNNTDYFSHNIEDILFPLATQNVEAEHDMEVQAE